jgi:hypothetical protein
MLSRSTHLSVVWDLDHPTESSQYASILQVLPFLSDITSITTSGTCPSSEAPIEVFVRLRSYPDLARPPCCPRDSCAFVVYLPWDFGCLPDRWVGDINQHADAVWALSTYNAAMFRSSGISRHMIRTVPFGIDCTQLQSKRNLRQELDIPIKAQVYGYVAGDLSALAVPMIFELFADIFSHEAIFGDGERDAVLLIALPYEAANNATLAMLKNSRVRILDSHSFEALAIEEVDVYAVIDVYLHPFVSEWSMSPVQVLALGKTVLTGSSGVMRDYLVQTPFSEFVALSKSNDCAGSQCIDKLAFNNESKAELNGLEVVRVSYNELKRKMRRLFRHPAADPHRAMAAEARLFVCTLYQWANISTIVSYELHRAQQQRWTEVRNNWSDESALPKLLAAQLLPKT